MKKKKGFTLVELLAVIVILAVILVIAVPQIMSVIESARKGSIESTAKLIAEGAEREYTNRKILGKDTNIKCTDVSSMNSNDYGSCVITFDNAGKATVKVTGKGKFEGYTCNGNSTNMECIKSDVSEPTETDASYFTYEENAISEVTIKDKDKCVAYLQNGWSEEQANTLCSGNALDDGYTLNLEVYYGEIPSSDYEDAGLEMTYGIAITGYLVGEVNNVIVKDKDKCVAYLLNLFNDTPVNAPEEQANTLCSGNALDNGKTLKDGVQEGEIPSSDYATAGLEVTYNGGGTDVVIPSEIDGKKVVAIANYAFTTNGITPTTINNTKKVSASHLYNVDNKNEVTPLNYQSIGLGITSVVIPDTVKTISDSAFRDNKLTEVTIPSSVTHIGEDAFGNNQLTSIILPSTSLTIECGAFNDNPITKNGTYTYPDNVTGYCRPL